MSKPNQLFLLADHIKLSLLERHRAESLNLDSDSQNGHISRSIDQFRDGLTALEKEKERLESAGDARYVCVDEPFQAPSSTADSYSPYSAQPLGNLESCKSIEFDGNISSMMRLFN
jgi:hypothetical protein